MLHRAPPQPSLEHAVKSHLVIISQELGNVRQNDGAAVSDRRSNGCIHEMHVMWLIFPRLDRLRRHRVQHQMAFGRRTDACPRYFERGLHRCLKRLLSFTQEGRFPTLAEHSLRREKQGLNEIGAALYRSSV